ncbi:MAG: IS1595 family transposase [Holosporales bacterium]|jgi:transposase|nr:IS1595 family transposase [Holosporales bacterium]
MRKSRLSKPKQAKLIEFFVVGATARSTAEILDINKNTVALYFHKLRLLIYQNNQQELEFSGEVEIDESYFGGIRKGKRGRGAAGKVPVFGLLKRGGKVYTQIIENAKTSTLLPIIKEKIKPDSVVYTNNFRSYSALDVSGFKHYRINHSKLFADKHNHINGIENFWNQAKRYMRKFNGIDKKYFSLFLKKCEWRFNTWGPRALLIDLKRTLKELF